MAYLFRGKMAKEQVERTPGLSGFPTMSNLERIGRVSTGNLTGSKKQLSEPDSEKIGQHMSRLVTDTNAGERYTWLRGTLDAGLTREHVSMLGKWGSSKNEIAENLARDLSGINLSGDEMDEHKDALHKLLTGHSIEDRKKLKATDLQDNQVIQGVHQASSYRIGGNIGKVLVNAAKGSKLPGIEKAFRQPAAQEITAGLVAELEKQGHLKTTPTPTPKPYSPYSGGVDEEEAPVITGRKKPATIITPVPSDDSHPSGSPYSGQSEEDEPMPSGSAYKGQTEDDMQGMQQRAADLQKVAQESLEGRAKEIKLFDYAVKGVLHHPASQQHARKLDQEEVHDHVHRLMQNSLRFIADMRGKVLERDDFRSLVNNSMNAADYDEFKDRLVKVAQNSARGKSADLLRGHVLPNGAELIDENDQVVSPAQIGLQHIGNLKLRQANGNIRELKNTEHDALSFYVLGQLAKHGAMAKGKGDKAAKDMVRFAKVAHQGLNDAIDNMRELKYTPRKVNRDDLIKALTAQVISGTR